jgi:hypothetical protein
MPEPNPAKVAAEKVSGFFQCRTCGFNSVRSVQLGTNAPKDRTASRYKSQCCAGGAITLSELTVSRNISQR